MRGVFFSCCLALAAGAADAQQMTAVAVSPDGSTVMAAGDNRVLYTIDAATLDVTHRRYVPDMVRELEFSANGRALFMRTDERNFRAVAAGSFKLLYEVPDIYAISYAGDADRIALLESNYDGGVLHIRAAGSGKAIEKLEYPDIDTEMVALAPDGASAILLTDSEKSENEAKESPPSDLKGYDKRDFRQKHDGYTSQVLAVNLGDGSYAATETFYRVSYPSQVRMLDGKAIFLNGTSDSGYVGADGAAVLLNLGDSYVAGARISDDGSTLMLNSGTDLSFHPFTGTGAGDAKHELEVERLDGPAERMTAADEAGDGTIYVVTNAYRIWKISPDKANVEVRPVY